ncbi:unnamed protein product [Durusdinium trenchii]|uniref:Uncharacterized protein n=1 Tax=Durusdinium trenchii TaxID=1381693 RepID=A0ABP0KKM3_9DINO
MCVRQEKLRECVELWHEKAAFLSATLRSCPALVDPMSWNRIVIADFQQSEAWQSCLRALGAKYRWGLWNDFEGLCSSTCSVERALNMAELLHYAGGDAMRQALKFRKSKSKQASLWLADPSNKQKIQEECQEMLRDAVRPSRTEPEERCVSGGWGHGFCSGRWRLVTTWQWDFGGQTVAGLTREL